MNHLARSVGAGALGLAVTVTLGCQAKLAMVPSIFQISKEQEGASISTAGAATTGRLTIVISGFLDSLRQRRVLATVADIERVTITVTANDGQVYSQTIAKAALSGGQATASFTGIAVGLATVKLEAFDVNGQSLGASTRSTLVLAGQTRTVAVPLMIESTAVTSPGSGGSSGGSTPHGSIAVNGTIADAFEVVAFDLGASCEAIAADPSASGGVWAATTGGPLKHFAADGSELASITVSQTPWAFVVDTEGQLWLPSATGASRFDPAAGPPDFGVRGAVFVDRSSTGHIWSAIVAPPTAQSLTRFNADGTIAQQAMLSMVPYDIAVADDGSAWITEEYFSTDGDGTHNAIKFSPNGTEVVNIPIGYPAQAIDVDAAGNAWIATQFGLMKLSPTGEDLGLFTDWSLADVLVAQDGHVWVLAQDRLHRFNHQGQEVGYLDLLSYGGAAFDIGHLGSYLAQDGQGNVWLAWGSKLLKITL